MVTQPQLVVFASSVKRLRSQTVHGTEFRFVFIKPEHYFGTVKHWVTKQESVDISDLERTIIDGLRQPYYCGGVTEVAKGLWMRHEDMQPAKLVGYALRLGTGGVLRRLGYLLDSTRSRRRANWRSFGIERDECSARSHAARGGDAFATLAAPA